MIDLLLHAADKATLRTFAENHPPANPIMIDGVDEEGSPIKVVRDGVRWLWWNGGDDGKVTTVKQKTRTPQQVAQAADPEFAFNVGATPPAWVTDDLYVVDDDLAKVGTFDRIQGNFAVFTLEPGATLPAVNDTLTPISPAETLGGVVLHLRIWKDFFNSDRIVPDEADPDKEEQWARSKIVQYVKNNGTPDTFDLKGTSIPYYELDGVKFTKPQILYDALDASGGIKHIRMGGMNW